MNIEAPDGLQGFSLNTIMTKQNNMNRTFVFGEDGSGVYVQNEEWMYFLPYDASGIEDSKLYNKKIDPKESINVCSKYPELSLNLYKQAELMSSYVRTLANKPKNEDTINKVQLDPEKVKRLQNEGYF